MARQSYLKNAAILTGTGLLLRAAGMFFRIYIAARIGAEGMGLYQLIYTVYTMAVTLATAGLSVAATRLSAELLATDDPANVRAAMLITWRVFAIFAFLTKSSVHNNSRELQEKERYIYRLFRCCTKNRCNCVSLEKEEAPLHRYLFFLKSWLFS